jgi:hypothetical protein
MGEYPGRLVREQTAEFARRVVALNGQLAHKRQILDEIAQQSAALAAEVEGQDWSVAGSDAATLTAAAVAEVLRAVAADDRDALRLALARLETGVLMIHDALSVDELDIAMNGGDLASAQRLATRRAEFKRLDTQEEKRSRPDPGRGAS